MFHLFLPVPLLRSYHLTPVKNGSDNSSLLMFGVVGRKVQVFVSLRLLPVHCIFQTAIFLSGELRNQEGHAVVFFVFSRENDATCGVYSAHVYLPFLCVHHPHILSSFVVGNLPVLWLLCSAPGPPCTDTQQ